MAREIRRQGANRQWTAVLRGRLRAACAGVMIGCSAATGSVAADDESGGDEFGPEFPNLEPRRPAIEFRRPLAEPRTPQIEPHRPNIEFRRPLAEPRRPMIERGVIPCSRCPVRAAPSFIE